MMRKAVATILVALMSLAVVFGQDNVIYGQDSQKKSSGYKGYIEIGGGPAIGKYGSEAFILSTTHGYAWRHVFVGVGAALNRINHYETSMVTFYGDLRVAVPELSFDALEHWVPFAGIRAGYSPFTTKNTYNRYAFAYDKSDDRELQHGPFFQPMLGINVVTHIGKENSFWRRLGFTFSVSDAIQRAYFYYIPQQPDTEAHYMHSIVFSAAVSF